MAYTQLQASDLLHSPKKGNGRLLGPPHSDHTEGDGRQGRGVGHPGGLCPSQRRMPILAVAARGCEIARYATGSER